MDYKDINIDNMIILVHGKGNKERFVPLGKMSLQLLQSYSNICPYHNEYVFCNKDGSKLTTNAVKKFMNKLKRDTGLANLSSHKLRHNFATNYCLDMLKNKGLVDIYKLSAILGHEDVETTKIYLHIAEKLLAASGFDSHLDSILLGKN